MEVDDDRPGALFAWCGGYDDYYSNPVATPSLRQVGLGGASKQAR